MNNGLLHTSRYTMPALGLCTDLPPKRILNLQDRISRGGFFTENEIKEFFPNAYGFLHTTSKEMELDMWDIQVSKEYWFKKHNIDNPPLCQVRATTYQEKMGLRPTPKYMGKLQNGDPILIHLNAAVERI
ncbi:hypothetical protein HNV12_01890 [Methanococcoides sp. SA1]|nr:hypothetical protein [Methanococcoides sp. SA1]